MKKFKVLVTGGAGFIGSHLVDSLLESKNEVVVLDNFSSGKIKNLTSSSKNNLVTIIKGDILNIKDLTKAMKGCSVVFHLAVECVRSSIKKPLFNHEVNATGTLNTLEVARKLGVQRFVYCSSSEIYGNTGEKLLDEDKTHYNPVTVYGSSKLVGEYYTRSYFQTYGLPVVIVRPFNTYGPRCQVEGHLAEVIPRFALSYLNNRKPIIFGDGNNGRDFTYVTDVVKGIKTASTVKEALGEVINIAYGKMITVNEISKVLQKKIGNKTKPKQGKKRPGDVIHLRANTKKAQKILDYKATIDFNNGIDLFLEWIKKANFSGTNLTFNDYNW